MPDQEDREIREERLRYIRCLYGLAQGQISYMQTLCHVDRVLFPFADREGKIFALVSGETLCRVRDSSVEDDLLAMWDEKNHRLITNEQGRAELSALKAPGGDAYRSSEDLGFVHWYSPDRMRDLRGRGSQSVQVAHTVVPRNEQYLERYPFREWAFRCEHEGLWFPGLPELGRQVRSFMGSPIICSSCGEVLGIMPNFDYFNALDAIYVQKSFAASGPRHSAV